LQLQSTLGARKVDVSFRPDCTVGPGITPSPTAAAARGLSSSLLPPVGNFTLPQRTVEVYAALKTCQTSASTHPKCTWTMTEYCWSLGRERSRGIGRHADPSTRR